MPKYGPNRPEVNKHGLTPKEQLFCKNYANAGNPDTYLNAQESYSQAYNTPNKHYSQTASHIKMKKVAVQKTLKDLLDRPNIRKLIEDGMEERLKDPFSRYFQPSAEFVAKVLGDFAPEKVVNANLDLGNREDFYAKVMADIEAKEKSAHIETSFVPEVSIVGGVEPVDVVEGLIEPDQILSDD